MNSPDYNPDDWYLDQNGNPVGRKSEHQKRMEALEKKYLQGDYDKTPKFEG